MTRKISKIKCKMEAGEMRITFLSTNRAGTSYSLGTTVVPTAGLPKETIATSIVQAIKDKQAAELLISR